MTSTIALVDLERLRAALGERGVAMEYFSTGAEALARLKELVPLDTEVMTGSSMTLEAIGFIDWLKQMHDQGLLRYFRYETQHMNDAEARAESRRQAATAQYFLGSVNALAMTGEAVVSDHSGTRLVGYVYGGKNVIWVAGINKIVPTLDDAIRRVKEIALPLEDARIRAEGGEGSSIGKLTIFCWERPGRIRLLLIGEELGY